MSTPLTAERRDELDALHRAVEVKGIRVAIFMLGYWGALLFGANKAAELWPQYFARAPLRQSSLSWVSLGTAIETTEIGGCCRCSKTGWKRSRTKEGLCRCSRH